MTDKELAMVAMVTRNYTYQQVMDEMGVTRKEIKNAVALAKKETGAWTKVELWYALTYGKKFYRGEDIESK